GDAASVNGGFTLVTNALGAAESTAVETGSNAEINTRGPWNSNTGIVSNASFDPLSEAALTEGLTVKWVVTSIGPSVHANGNTYVIATDSVFFNTLPHIGLNFSGAQAGTDQLAVRYRDPPRGIGRIIISTQQPYEASSWNDGFTAEFTISRTGWSYKVTGLNDSTGTPTIFTESNTWVDSGPGLAETFLSDLLDNDCYVSAFAQEDGCTANYDRCTVYIGKMLPEAAILGPADGAKGVQRDVTLSWTPGEGIDKHDVYFGSNFDNVNDATRDNSLGVLVSQNQDSISYSPVEVLQFGQTYYWRIDEVGPAPDFTIYKGKVWQFTVETYAYPVPSENITATASSSNKASEGPENTINGSGLDDNDLHSVVGTDTWLSSAAGSQPTWIQYEFDKVYKLHEMWAWNYNLTIEPLVGFGLKDVTIEYSANGTDYTTLGTTHEFAQAPGAAGYAHNTTVDFEGVAAQYVRLTANSNWGMLPQYGLSEVRFFHIPVRASEPSPDSGATDVDLDVVLSWEAGREAAQHDVYISSDEQAVIDGTAAVATVSETSYGPLSLDLGMTYYWKINEVNLAETPTTLEGDLWNFTTAEYLVVDDFESYNDLDPDDPNSNRIFNTWIDGFEQPTNGSVVGYASPPFCEQTIVHGGGQSMPLFYDNSGTARYSEAELTLSPPQDWTKQGVNALSLWFSGDPNNVPDQMYVKINGSKVTYDGDADNLTLRPWQPWNVDLPSLGIDLQNVTKFSIGFGDEAGTTPGGSGLVFFDGIRLYPYSRQLATPAEPAPGNLVAHYEFEGTASDSSGNGLHGTAMGDPAFVAGKIGQAISLDGFNNFVEITGYKGILGPNAVTVTAWINTTAIETGAIVGWGANADGQRFGFRVNDSRIRMEHAGGNVQGDTSVNDGGWHHVAVTVQASATISYPDVILYIDGIDDTRASTDPDAFNLTADQDVRIGSRPSNNDRFFMGLIDDVRIYDRALTPEEIAWLAGRTEPFDKPF
ncbi:MAG: LamG-like jellyroll fold domain-containing protein, partial [Planctomycetota bacterium]